MRVAGARETRENLAAILAGGEPVLVTRHGKLSGVYLPLKDPDHLPIDLRREMAAVLGRHLSAILESVGVDEDAIQRDFDAHRRGRQRR